MIKVRILGCGSSLGVPVIGCTCQVCISDSKYNKRLRSSLLIEKANKNILVDFGYDLREQLLRENIQTIDASILTHGHSDHLSAIDDLRPFHMIHELPPVEIYTSESAHKTFQTRFPYLKEAMFFKMNIISEFQQIQISDINIQFFNQDHSSMDSLGFRIGNFAYANDLIAFYPASEQYLYDLEILVVDCLALKSTQTHAGLDRVMEWYNKFQPKQIFLTNMSHSIEYFEIMKILPQNIRPLHDGQIIDIS